MISAAKYFYIGTASERSANAHQHIAFIDLGYIDRLYFEVLPSVEYGGHHLSFHEVHLCG